MSKLRQSASEWCYFKNQYEPAFYYHTLKETGFAAVEMVDPKRWSAARAAGLEILNVVGPGMQKGLNRIEHHATLLPEIRRLIKQAASEGIKQVIIFSGNREGLDDETGLKNCIEGGKALAKDAERAGVTLTLELLNSFGHKDYQADHGKFGFSFVQGVSSPSVKILYDIFHMKVMGDNLEEDILKNLGCIAHFHTAASPERDFPSVEKSPEYSGIVKKAHAAGYKGCWGHEFIPSGDALEELVRVFKLFESYI